MRENFTIQPHLKTMLIESLMFNVQFGNDPGVFGDGFGDGLSPVCEIK